MGKRRHSFTTREEKCKKERRGERKEIARDRVRKKEERERGERGKER